MICERCEFEEVRRPWKFCPDCSKTIDRIIVRAMDAGELTAEEIGADFGLSADAVWARASRYRRRVRVAEPDTNSLG